MTTLRNSLEELCSRSRHPTKTLRNLLRNPGESGMLQLHPPVAIQETSALSALFDCFIKLGFRDERQIRPLMREISFVISSLDSSLKLLENASKIGYVDELVTGSLLAKTLKRYDPRTISLQDAMRILRIMQTQRYRHRYLIDSLTERVLREGDTSQRFVVFRILAELDMVDSSRLVDFPRPVSASDSIDFAWGILLQENKLASSVDIPGMLRDCLVALVDTKTDSTSQIPESCEHKLVMIRDAIYLLHRETVYRNLPERTKSFLSGLGDGNPGKRTESRAFRRGLKQISDTLFSENVAHSVHSLVGSFMVDIVERDRKIIWEYDSRDRFYHDGSETSKSSYHVFKRRVLNAMGYNVINIPHWQWAKMGNKKLKKDYCRTSRFLALTDMGKSVETDRDPRCYKVSECMPSEPSSWDFHNEYVHNKQQPKQSWVWNKPIPTLRVAI